MIMEQQTVEQMKRQLIGEIKLTPSEVRKYYSQLSKDSLPNIPTTVEVQIITMEPKIPFEETDAIKRVFGSIRMRSIGVKKNFRLSLVCIPKILNLPKGAVNWVFWVRQVCCPNSLTSLST